MIDIIIPIHNISNDRDISRVKWSVYSLNKQTVDVNVIIACSSKWREQERLQRLLRGMKHQFIPMANKELNMPLLHRAGITAGSGKWIGTTGADFVFHKSVIERYMHQASQDTLCLKQVRVFPKMTISESVIDNWNFPTRQECVRRVKKMGEMYSWGLNDRGLLNKVANGALQFACREFWENICVPPEQMSKLGAYDNWVESCAKKNAMKIVWVTRSEIGHQWHKISKLKFDDQFNKNITYVHNYNRS